MAQEGAKLAKVKLIEVARSVGEDEFVKTGGMIVGVGTYKGIATGDDRIIKHEVYPAEVLMDNYQRLPRPIPFEEFRNSLTTIPEGRKKGAWLMMQQVNFWLNKQHSKLIPKLVAAGKGDISLLQKDVDEGKRSFQLTPDEKKSIYGAKAPKKKKFSERKFSNWYHEHVIPISTRLGRVDVRIKDRLKQFDFEEKTISNKDRTAIRPFAQKFEQLNKRDYTDLDLALKNRDQETIEEILTRNNMYEDWIEVRNTLDRLYGRAREAGIDIGFLPGYYPRRIIDLEGFLNEMDEEVLGIYEKAIKEQEKELERPLEDAERAAVINQITGRGSFNVLKNKPDATRSRTVRNVTPQLNQYYEHSLPAIHNYINSMNQAIVAQKLLGRGKGVKDSVGELIDTRMQEGGLDATQQKELATLLRGRFDRDPHKGWVVPFKNIIYTLTLTQFKSVMTQMGDAFSSLYNAGFYLTGKGAAKSLIGKDKVTRQDIGIEQISEEMGNIDQRGFSGKTSKWLNNIMRRIGFTAFDGFFKETFINSAILKYQRDAKNGNKATLAKIDRIFGERSKEVVDALKSGEITDDVKYLAFDRLADFQPISKTEMPLGYVQNKGGRKAIFYQLKSFTIKQIDAYRTEGLDKIRFGKTKKEKVEGLKNLIRLAGFLC